MVEAFSNVLPSIREKLKNIQIDGDATLDDVKKEYRKLFNNDEYHYEEDEHINSDILVEKCGIKNIADFYKLLGCCWIDFFGCDSFSETQEKKQIFFATLCSEDSAVSREVVVKDYKRWLKNKIPVDIFIQIFFATEEELEQYQYLKRIPKEGFFIKFKKQNPKPDYTEEFKSVKKEICKKEILFEAIEKSINEEKGLLYIDYECKFGPNTTLTDEAHFIKGVCDINWSLHKEVENVYFMPIPCPDGSIGLVCLGAKTLDPNDLNQINTFAFSVLYPFVSSYKTVWHRIRLKKEAIKSAKAAIMSRNLSHNLGSHVMSYMKQSLGSVADMEKSGALAEAFSKGVAIDKELPYLVGAGRFISYLQERQDYIATVSTDYIPYQSVVNFKDSIYDELNPDYRFQRHQEWTGHKPYNILLENIAKSEGLSRKLETQDGNNIIISFRSFNGLNTESNADYDDLRTYNFSLPGGIMGRQAIFSIVENIIRNAAKHGTRKSGEDLIVTFDIIDPHNEIMLGKVDFGNRYKKSTDIDDLYIVTITTSGTLTEDDGKNEKIVQDIINKITEASNVKPSMDQMTLRESNKGIKEMLISSAWLRGVRYEELDKEKANGIAPILRVRQFDKKLQYVFCVPKAKEVALIIEDETLTDLEKKDKNFKKKWSKHGWYVFSKEKYCKQNTSKNYGFVILDSKLDSDIDEVRKCSNNRFFVESDYTDFEHRRIKTDIIKRLKNIKEEEFEEEKVKLYEQLAAEDEDFRVAISDGLEMDIHSEHIVNVQKLSNVEGSLPYFKFIYRKHNDSKKDFDGFVGKFKENGGDLNSLIFIEGITGGNSTDRLVRHCALDDLWAFQHVHAMKTKVAIFDERIFTKITSIDLSKLKTKNWGNEDELMNMNDEQARSFVKEYDSKRRDVINSDWDLIVDFETFTKEEVIKFALDNYPMEDDVEITEYLPLVYSKKGIDVYTMTEDLDGILIWGVQMDSSFNGIGRVKQIGRLEWSEVGKPSLRLYVKQDEKYNYLTIHQGLLDKVYKRIPRDDSGAITSDNKREVSRIIYERFVTKSEKNDFLQGLIIHSGRSKPNNDDMPQHQPFIQYSALENAVFDCKMTLVELLDYACYENEE